MTNEELLQQQITKKFPSTEGKCRIQRERRIWVQIPVEEFIPFIDYLYNELKVVVFGTMTGLDDGDKLSFINHLAQESGIMVNVQVSVPKTNPVVPTITKYFPAADLSEREVEDLLGARVDGLKSGRRYPLPDDWPLNSYPLLKNWKPDAPTANTEVK